jgi:serine phosphatase RsbU (regulator of sigma subunit)
MIRTLDTGASAERLARLVVPRLADWATVTVLDEDGGAEQTGRAHRDESRLADLDTYLAGRLRGARDRPALVSALLSGKPVQVTSIEPALSTHALPSDALREAWERLEASSAVFVPLLAHGRTFGALSLISCGDRPPLDEAQIDTAVEVARRGALALDNARLYSRQLRVAETLQRSLLTPPPKGDGLQIAVRYRPASSYALVGGDFYDAFHQPDGATVAVVGDVAGHSVEATAAMSQLRSTVRTLAYDRPGSPAQTLTRVDRALGGLGFGTLATVVLARVEQPREQAGTGRHTLRWSSAGHLPPVVVRADGVVEVLDTAPERLLGAGAPVRRTDHEAPLGPGDTVVLYTDGLLERPGVGIDEGLARLTDTLADLAGLPLEQLCDEVLDRLVGDRAADDVALLAFICRREEAGR